MREKSALNPCPFLCPWRNLLWLLDSCTAHFLFSTSWSPSNHVCHCAYHIVLSLFTCLSLFLNCELTKDSSGWESSLISQCLVCNNCSINAYQTNTDLVRRKEDPGNQGGEHPWTQGTACLMAWVKGGPELRPLPFYATEFVAVLPGHEQPAAPGSL